MSWFDWAIVVVPLAFVMGLGVYSRRYVRGVVDFLAAGRVCGRYVISVGDIATALSIIGLVAYVEVHYKTGFALSFWHHLVLPVGIVISLTGYCTYRFRETKAMSMGQFLEMRYSRRFRIFAASLRSISEMLANMIMPAVAARFFIYFLDLPHTVRFFGLELPTFVLIVLFVLSLAITLVCLGGTLTLLITDAVQGMICYPLMALFVIFILMKFSWSQNIVPVMLDRAAGESFLNPYDISKLRDFNLFALVVGLFGSIIHRASWTGAGFSMAARSPHEQKMAGVLGTWRGALNSMLYVIMAVAILTIMNHAQFSGHAQRIRATITNRVTGELVEDPALRAKVTAAVAAVPLPQHTIGRDAPLSEDHNLDTPVLDAAHQALLEGKDGHAKFQQFRTLYHQMMMAVSMRDMLPVGLLGMFCLLMVLAMVSTDSTRIFSSSLTITQDVVLPLRKQALTPERHIRMIRWISVGVGVFFVLGSFFMAQMDYINLFVTIMTSMWMGGCGPVMIFGLYSRFGTTAGAWVSLVTGMVLSTGGALVQRNWASLVYPWLERHGWVDTVGQALARASEPFNPYIVWKMNPVKFPINSYEIYFGTMLVTLALYCIVSWLTLKEPFNLDRMLHRGKYNLDGEMKDHGRWTPRTVLAKLIGITPEYTLGDRVTAWAAFAYSFGYSFVLAFVCVVIWNAISPWPVEWWGHYFLVVSLVVPGIVALVMTFWMGIGGIIDLRRLFRDLKAREVNHLDDGRVEGHVSLADKERMERLDRREETAARPPDSKPGSAS